MDFGIFNIMQQRSAAKPVKQVFDEAVEQTVVAEQLGYTRSWYAEHHFSNYSLCPSPLMMAAHMAGRTRRIRLGTAVVVAPLYKPARLLAEIGMVDNLSGGRLDLGIGMGYQRYEFERFGVELDDAKEITHETLDMIEAGLSRPAFEYTGRHYRQMRSSINCRPLQTPTPPIWFAGGEPELLRRAARNGYTVLISGVLGGLSRMRQMREQYERLAALEGKQPQELRLGIARLAFVSNSKKDVERYLDAALYQQRLAVSLKSRREVITNDYIVEERPYDDEPSHDDMLRNLPVGDVDTCVQKMLRTIRELKPVHIAIQTQVGDIDHRKSLESMRLWAEEVIPAVRRELGVEP